MLSVLVAAIGPLDGSGYATRIDSMIGAYAAAGWHVDLVHVRRPDQAPATETLSRKLRRYVELEVPVRRRDHMSLVPPLARLAGRAWNERGIDLGSYDVAQAESSAAWEVVARARAHRRVLVFHDDDSVRYRRLAHQVAGLPRKAARLTAAWKYDVYQRRAARGAEMIWFVSDDERRRFANGHERTRLVPNGAGREFFDVAAEPDGTTVAFVGPAGYDTNRRAVDQLVAHAWPAIRACVPSAELRLIGRGWEAHEDREAGIVASGWVDDLPAALGETAVAVAPHLDGGGTKLKIIEAMAAARPVVATVVGAEGIPVSPGMVIADDPDGFARAVVELLRDKERRRRSGRSNRAAVEHLEWSRIWAPVVAGLQGDLDSD